MKIWVFTDEQLRLALQEWGTHNGSMPTEVSAFFQSKAAKKHLLWGDDREFKADEGEHR